jgi:signal transduction histidine kinase
MQWIRSLRGRLTAAMLIVFGLGVGNVAIYVLDIDEDLRGHLMEKQLDTMLSRTPLDPDGQNLGILPTWFAETDWRYSLFDAGGHLLATSPKGDAPLVFMPPGKRHFDAQSARLAREIAQDRVLVVAKNDWLEREEGWELVRDEIAGSLLVILVLGALSLLAVIGLVHWTLRSVRQAASLAGSIGVEHPDRRIPLGELPDEIKPLARSANDALDKLAAAFAAERRFTADAAHELRTPLTVLSLRLQRAKREGVMDWSALDREMAQMRRLVDQLLSLARQESHAAIRIHETASVNISRVVREAVADIMLLFEAAGRTIDADIVDGLLTPGSGGQLREAVQNLLENGLLHGRGVVRVTLYAAGPSRIHLDVEDEGENPPPELQEALFERFRKGVQSSSGSGLGLAIVRQILSNHGGDVIFVPGPRFRIRLVMMRQ